MKSINLFHRLQQHSIVPVRRRGNLAVTASFFGASLRIDRSRFRTYSQRMTMSCHVTQFGCNIGPGPAGRCQPLLRALLAFLLPQALALAPAPAQPTTIRVPFHTVKSMILVEGRANGDTLTFLLDTGSIGTIVSARMYHAHFPLHRMRRTTDGPGMIGESISTHMDLELGGHRWYAQRVSIMNLDELSGILGVKRIDGLLGQDVLREFRSVRIDYHAHIIELEE
jgi:hypothetical protein